MVMTDADICFCTDFLVIITSTVNSTATMYKMN